MHVAAMKLFLIRVCVSVLLLPAITVAAELLSTGMSSSRLQEILTTPQAPLVVDVRAPPEYAIAHIPGAVNIPLNELSGRMEEIQSDSGVLLYCFNGSRTRKAQRIAVQGMTGDLYHLEGAFEKWLQGGYPVEKGGTDSNTW